MSQLIDSPQSHLDKTVRVFDQFYNFDLVVGANQYEIVHSYFLEQTNSNSIARNFTTVLFRIANITGQDVLKLLEYLQGSNSTQMNGILIYYLNSLKSKTTLYGINVEPAPNQTALRNVVV